LVQVTGLQRGHGRGAPPSKPSIRMTWLHSPHHGSRGERAGGRGSSAGESRAARTAYGLHTPLVRVTGASNKRVSVAALIAIKPGCRTRLIYRVHPGRRRGKDQRKGFTETD
jgi:hypothetical protein